MSGCEMNGYTLAPGPKCPGAKRLLQQKNNTSQFKRLCLWFVIVDWNDGCKIFCCATLFVFIADRKLTESELVHRNQ